MIAFSAVPFGYLGKIITDSSRGELIVVLIGFSKFTLLLTMNWGLWADWVKSYNVPIVPRSKVELDEERVRSLKEKDEVKRQLEDLVVVERDQLVKTAARDQDQVRECEDEVARMADIVRSLKSELEATDRKLQVGSLLYFLVGSKFGDMW